jgi:hypothetical protein
LVPRTTRGRAEGGEQEAEGGEGAEDSLHAAHRTTAPERSPDKRRLGCPI